jgi:hypothetical protein
MNLRWGLLRLLMIPKITICAAAKLIAAGSIKGGFGQHEEPAIACRIKITKAVVLFAGLLFYLFILLIYEIKSL